MAALSLAPAGARSFGEAYCFRFHGKGHLPGRDADESTAPEYVKRVSKIERGRQAELSGTQLYRDHADEKAGVQQRDKVPT